MTSPFAQAAARVTAGESTAAHEARSLVAQMTRAEKLDCLDGDLDAWPGLIDLMQGGYHRHTFPGAAVPRLGVPGIEFSDGPRGCVVGLNTAFPVSMARGASWNPELEERIGEAIGAELRAAGATFYGGVCVNLLRHPGWGRAQETYGEEPLHVGEMGRALMLGAQQHVMACVKHFAVNSMENARFQVDVHVDERALHEVYLPHFRRIVDSGVASVMSAYNSLNGTWCGDNHELLTGILRDEWGFAGFVISDFIYGLREAVRSVEAGLDIEMPFRQIRRMHLADALDRGRLDERTVDASVERILTTLLTFHDVVTRPAAEGRVLSAAHRALAREAATQSIVMLRNEPAAEPTTAAMHPVRALPLDPAALSRIAVIGRLARVPNLGDRGSSDVLVPDAVTLLDGLRAAVPHLQVDHSDRDTAIAEQADAAIVVVGYTHRDEGEYIGAEGTRHLLGTLFPPMTDEDRAAIAALGDTAAAVAPEVPVTADDLDASGFGEGGDRRSLTLSSVDETLILETVRRCPRTVVVVMGGSAVVMERWHHRVPAILLAWYPGIEGGHAIADVVFGTRSPGGRLPFTIPTDDDHLPHFDPDATVATYTLWHGHWLADRDGLEPAYPYGFGLGYSSFRLAELRVELTEPDATGFGGATVSVQVCNTGPHRDSTVVQVYGGLPSSTVERPRRRLIGFRRIELEPGEGVNLEVACDLRHLDVRLHRSWWTEGGSYRISVGQHSLDPDTLEVDVERSERRTGGATTVRSI